MRSALLLLALACGCGSAGDGAPPDLAAIDLAAAEQVTFCGDVIVCSNLVACLDACVNDACVTKCHNMAPAHTNALYQALDECLTAACAGVPDGGAGPCVPGGSFNACHDCINAAEGAGGACADQQRACAEQNPCAP